jgi:hypothetical protein
MRTASHEVHVHAGVEGADLIVVVTVVVVVGVQVKKVKKTLECQT